MEDYGANSINVGQVREFMVEYADGVLTDAIKALELKVEKSPQDSDWNEARAFLK